MGDPQTVTSSLNVLQVSKNVELWLVAQFLQSVYQMVDEARSSAKPANRGGTYWMLYWESDPTPRIHARIALRPHSDLFFGILEHLGYTLEENRIVL